MATFTVTTNSDVVDANDGVTSLREALTLANGSAGADKIVFDKPLAGSTIALSGELVLSSDVTINGDTNKDGDAGITISGGGNSRLNTVQAGATAALTSLNLTGGNEFTSGDVIQNDGGGGRDAFVLAKQAASADTIIGFVSGVDSIEISEFQFETGLPLGDLAPGRLRINTTGLAGDGNDRFIFYSLTGELSFDSNGSAAGGARIIASFSGSNTSIAASDFDIV